MDHAGVVDRGIWGQHGSAMGGVAGGEVVVQQTIEGGCSSATGGVVGGGGHVLAGHEKQQ